jgi:hypothetical protein
MGVPTAIIGRTPTFGAADSAPRSRRFAWPRRGRSSQRYHRGIMGRARSARKSGWVRRFRLLEDTLAVDNGPARSVLHASLLAIVPSLLMFGVLVASGIDALRTPTDTLDPAFIAYSVLLAPMIETAVMLALAAALARLVPKHGTLQIVLVALFAAVTHWIGGDWRQVAYTAWPILVYATSLVLWLRRSARDAFIVTTIVHALYNLAFFAVGILGPLVMGDS